MGGTRGGVRPAAFAFVIAGLTVAFFFAASVQMGSPATLPVDSLPGASAVPLVRVAEISDGAAAPKASNPSLLREADGLPLATSMVTEEPTRTGAPIVSIGYGMVPSVVDGLIVREPRLPAGVAGADRSRFGLKEFSSVTGTPETDAAYGRPTADIEVGLRVGGETLFYPSMRPLGPGESLPSPPAPFTDADAEEIFTNIAPLLGRRCPLDRFLTVNTHTWGRHHNQLQEIANTVAWADALNRTAIISYFRFKSQWHSTDNFYDFSEIRRRYCVVTHREADAILKLRERHSGAPRLTSRCLGQGMKGTRFRHMPNVVRCPSKLDLPAHYNSRHSVRISRGLISNYVIPNKDGFLVISGQITFYMRPGLWDMARLLRHLRPSPEVAALVDQQLLGNFFKKEAATAASDGTSVASRLSALQVNSEAVAKASLGSPSRLHPGAASLQTFPVYPYFSVHSRSREVDCLLEMSYDEGDNGGYLAAMGSAGGPVPTGGGEAFAPEPNDEGWDPKAPVPTGSSDRWGAARKQCRIGTDLVDAVVAETAPQNGTRLFLASDGQNLPFEEAMSARGALRAGAVGGGELTAMAVDFFLMAAGLHFTGNQLSSVSQNVCLMRLGNGLTCDGWFPVWTLYHTRNGLSRTIGPPPR